MEQGLQFCSAVEISCFAPQSEIGQEKRSRNDVLAKMLILICEESKPSHRIAGAKHEYQRRKNPPDATSVKFDERKSAPRELFKNYGRNEITRNYEEDVDANEPALERLRKRMEDNDRPDRDSTQAVDVRSVFVRRGWTSWRHGRC